MGRQQSIWNENSADSRELMRLNAEIEAAQDDLYVALAATDDNEGVRVADRLSNALWRRFLCKERLRHSQMMIDLVDRVNERFAPYENFIAKLVEKQDDEV